MHIPKIRGNFDQSKMTESLCNWKHLEIQLIEKARGLLVNFQFIYGINSEYTDLFWHAVRKQTDFSLLQHEYAHFPYCVSENLHVFSANSQRGTTFVTSCWLLWMTKSFQNGTYSLRKEFAQNFFSTRVNNFAPT